MSRAARAAADKPQIEDQVPTATDETQIADETVEGFTLEDALKTVLITNKNDGDAWAPLQSTGATDPEIRSTLTNLIGLEKRVSREKGICASSVESTGCMAIPIMTRLQDCTLIEMF